jgi:hypothetical protein
MVSDRYRTASAEAQRHLADFPPVQELVRAWCDMGELLFMSEAHFREAERCRTLGVHLGRVDDSFATGKRLNDAVRASLSEDVPARIRTVREHLTGLGDVDASAALEQCEQTAREVLADFPLTVYEAREADRLLTEGFAAGRAGGDALCDFAEQKVHELDQLRARREQHNEPASLILGAIAVVGAVASMISCAASGTCGTPGAIILTSFLALVGGDMIYQWMLAHPLAWAGWLP